MNRNDCKQVLFYAAEIFNERMGTTFNEENLVLSCFQTSNQEEVFEQFCKQYFPDRLTDRYKEEGYLIFTPPLLLAKGKTVWTASSCARILSALRQCSITSCCTSWRMFFAPTTSWVGTAFINATASTLSREEDGAINAGYAIWRELIAEVIAFEMDDRCVVLPLKEKKDILKYYVREIEAGDRKNGVSMILCEALTSKECETSTTWSAAQKKVAKHKPFDNPLYMELLELVYRNLRNNFVEIDREFILQLGSLYLCFVMQLEVKKLGRYLQTGNDTIGR